MPYERYLQPGGTYVVSLLVGFPYEALEDVIHDVVLLIFASDIAQSQGEVEAEFRTDRHRVAHCYTCAPVDLGLLSIQSPAYDESFDIFER